MLAVPHIVAGAAVGKAVRSPWIALPIAFLSHFALDSIPHLDSHGLFGRNDATTQAEIVAVAIDVTAAAALVLWAAGRQTGWRLIYAAAFAGILMDVVFNCPLWDKQLGAWQYTAWLSLFHHDVQHNVPQSQWPLGFSTQAVTIAASLWVLRAWKGSEARSEKVISGAVEVEE